MIQLLSLQNYVTEEDYLKKNVKGSRHFERYEKSEDEIIFPTSQEDIENYTVNETLKKEITEENIDLSTLQYDNTTDAAIINDTVLTSSGKPITTSLENVTIVDIVKDVMTSKSVKESTSDSTYNEYYSSDKSEVDIVTVTTLSAWSNDSLEENTSENSTKKNEKSKIVDDIVSSTTLSLLIDLKENTSTEVTTSDVAISTSPTRSDLEEDRDTENSTTKYSNDEKSTVMDNVTLINEIVTRENSPSTDYTSLMDEKFLTTTEIKSVMKI